MNKFLLASAGVTNPSIRSALLDLLDKPIEECRALCIPTASYAQPWGPESAWSFISGREPRTPMTELGWKSVGVLELTALPSAGENIWVPNVRKADVILVNGGDPMYLHYWMRQSGLADLLPSLDAVWVSLSAGSMIMTPRIGEFFVEWKPPTSGTPTSETPTSGKPTGGDETLGLVDFSIFPHLDHPDLPYNTMAYAEKWAATLTNPAYAMDDASAIKVVDGKAEMVSEGHWKLFTPETNN